MAQKVGFDPEPVQAWLDEHHDGDRLVAFTRVFTPNIATGHGDGSNDHGPITNTTATAAMLGLDPAQRSLLLQGRVGLLVLTADHFSILHVGGLRPRIKSALISEGLDRVTFAFRDVTEDKRLWRHWVIGTPDGRHIVEIQGMGKPGKPGPLVPTSDHLIAALGDRARVLK